MFFQETSTIKLNIKNAEIAFQKHIDDFAIVKLEETPQKSHPHHHTFFEMLYIEDGTLNHSIHGKKTQILSKGDYIFIDIGTSHEFSGEEVNVITIVFTPQFINKKLQFCSSFRELLLSSNTGMEQYASSFPADTVLHDTDGKLLNMLIFLKSKFDNPQILSKKIFKHCVTSILIHILEPHINNSDNTNPIIESLVKMIDEYYNEQNLLTRAANELNYTIPYISAMFKNHFGISFTEYLQIHRTNIAKTLLDTTNMSISDISYAVGYSNIKFFRTTFKKLTNMTPRQYRNTHYEGLK